MKSYFEKFNGLLVSYELVWELVYVVDLFKDSEGGFENQLIQSPKHDLKPSMIVCSSTVEVWEWEKEILSVTGQALLEDVAPLPVLQGKCPFIMWHPRNHMYNKGFVEISK